LHDRDYNASINIEKQGLKILSGSGIESDIKQKQGEALSLDKSLNLEMSIF
jgi:transposase